MEAVILLADAAQVSPDGKLHALGLGWQHTSAPTAPSAVVIIFSVPWDETNRKHRWTLDLLTADGPPVLLPTGPTSFTKIHAENEFEVGRPPGIKPGSPLRAPFAVNMGPLPLQADSSYEWVLKVGDREWRASFFTRP